MLTREPFVFCCLLSKNGIAALELYCQLGRVLVDIVYRDGYLGLVAGFVCQCECIIAVFGESILLCADAYIRYRRTVIFYIVETDGYIRVYLCSAARL